MCGRYSLWESGQPDDFEKIVQILNRQHPSSEFKRAGEVFPTDAVPVLANSRQLHPRPFVMRWGYSLPGGRTVINARSETAASSPLFADGMLHRRCLIPAAGYYEWARQPGGKVKYDLRGEGGLIYLAGVYRLEWRAEGILPVFAVLTREASPELSFLHDRMPVLFPPERSLAWLDPRCDVQELLRMAPIHLECHPAKPENRADRTK